MKIHFREAVLSAVLVGALIPAECTQAPSTPAGITAPAKMRFCAYFCFVLTKQGDHYNAVDDGVPNGTVKSVYRIVNFTRDNIVINRTDMAGGTAVLRGRLSADGQSVVDGNAEFHNTNGSVLHYPFQLA